MLRNSSVFTKIKLHGLFFFGIHHRGSSNRLYKYLVRTFDATFVDFSQGDKSFSLFYLIFTACCWRPKHTDIYCAGILLLSHCFSRFSPEKTVVFNSLPLTTNWEFASNPKLSRTYFVFARTNLLNKYFMLFENQSRSIKSNDWLWEII